MVRGIDHPVSRSDVTIYVEVLDRWCLGGRALEDRVWAPDTFRDVESTGTPPIRSTRIFTAYNGGLLNRKTGFPGPPAGALWVSTSVVRCDGEYG